jgi:hypothetical protein
MKKKKNEIIKLGMWDFAKDCGVEPVTKTHMKLSAILANQHNIIDAINLLLINRAKESK